MAPFDELLAPPAGSPQGEISLQPRQATATRWYHWAGKEASALATAPNLTPP